MIRVLCVIAAALVMNACALEAATSGRVAVSDGRNAVDVRFSDRDRAVIEDYYASLPPGLAKRNGLPPGLAKHRTLPPGLRQRPLPEQLEARLSPLPSPYARVQVDGDVVLMNRNTRLVLDIVHVSR